MTAVTATSSALLAHQGGWDEILLIGGPIVIIMGLLWLAKRRVDHAAARHGHGQGEGEGEGDGDGDGVDVGNGGGNGPSSPAHTD